jgi:hypothetical protein
MGRFLLTESADPPTPRLRRGRRGVGGKDEGEEEEAAEEELPEWDEVFIG